jgi:hypothetical protein
MHRVLEGTDMAPVPQNLDYISYAAGTWIPAPSIEWDGSVMDKGWWMNITNRLQCRSGVVGASAGGDFSTGMGEVLRYLAGRELRLELVPAGRGLLKCSLGTDGLVLSKFVGPTLIGWDAGWENEERGYAVPDVMEFQAG